ncbi:MAG TPA: hypothetical protein P5128_03365, partial [Candidatus Sumerlaeia bacterium]|nr:hypothetical protein [Candidatus Sumerlaeia bacterium]
MELASRDEGSGGLGTGAWRFGERGGVGACGGNGSVFGAACCQSEDGLGGADAAGMRVLCGGSLSIGIGVASSMIIAFFLDEGVLEDEGRDGVSDWV